MKHTNREVVDYIKVQSEFIMTEEIILLAYLVLQKHPEDFFIWFQPTLYSSNSFIKNNWNTDMSLDMFDECMREVVQDMWTNDSFTFHDTNGIFKCLTNRRGKEKSASLQDIKKFFEENFKAIGI